MTKTCRKIRQRTLTNPSWAQFPKQLQPQSGGPTVESSRRREVARPKSCVYKSNNDWLSVGEYDDPASAAVMSRLLSFMKMPHRVVPRIDRDYVPPPSGPISIWVAPENFKEAKRILAEGQVSDEELTSLALREPPPDDA
jgi:hypothetical protein